MKRKQGHIGRWGLLRKEDQKNERIENSKTLRVISKQKVKSKTVDFPPPFRQTLHKNPLQKYYAET